MMDTSFVRRALAQISGQIGRAVFGVEEHTRLALIAFMANSHVLLEGVPGTGKTLFARAFARSLGLSPRRLQCTPDLMPGDVLGANIFDFRTQAFSLTRGPVFTEFLLADEINRTPPKTQSALLEAMQERSVTIDGVTHALPDRFIVVATQNPIEHEGTYPLPEAQLDRFLFKFLVPYPAREQELHAVLTHSRSAQMPDLDALGVGPALSAAELDALRSTAGEVRVEEKVAAYAVELARATRDHEALSVGLSPRASTLLVAAARCAAACEGRDYVIPDDVKSLMLPIGRHRVALTSAAQMEGLAIESILTEIAERVPAPR
jgi:MoxR-like ATPase